MFTPTLDWGNELWTSLVWIARGWAIAAVCTLVVLVLIYRFTTWGRQFWRITGAYFTGPDSVKVWLWLAALLLSVIAGVRLQRAPQLPGQRHDDQLPGGCRGPAGWQRGRERLWRARLLDIHDVFCILAALYIARLLLDMFMAAAVHAGVAGVADRPAHRGLARRQGLLPGPLHRRHDRQPRSADPVRHRHLHRRQWTASQRPVLRVDQPRCCSARSRRSRRWFPSPRSCGTSRAR